MSKDLEEAKAAAQKQKVDYFNQQYAYHDSKTLEASIALAKIEKLDQLTISHAWKIAKGRKLFKAKGKNIEFWKMVSIKFQALHDISPEIFIKKCERSQKNGSLQ